MKWTSAKGLEIEQSEFDDLGDAEGVCDGIAKVADGPLKLKAEAAAKALADVRTSAEAYVRKPRTRAVKAGA